MSGSGWERASLAVIAALCATKALVHLALVNRYGYHGDELYFIECGRHLAFGYVDHPPLIPWVARLADELGGSLVALRAPAIAAGTGTMLLAASFVRDWGGGWRAQLFTLLCLLVAPAYLRMGTMLAIPVFEVFLCTATAYLVSRALAGEGGWTWVRAGSVLGLAILAKHSALYWAVGLALGVMASPHRAVLATRWPWFGAVTALAVAAPNLVWQVENGFPTLEFLTTLQDEVLAPQERWLLLAGQLLYFHPLALPVWSAGLVFAFTAKGHSARPFAVLFLTLFLFMLLMRGKPYYLASAYPPVLAAGGVALERWLAAQKSLWRVLGTSLALTGAALGALTLPVLPIQKVDAALGAALGWAVPPEILTEDMHGMHGWNEHATSVDRVYRSLSSAERERATVLAATYAQASAINVLGDPDTPRAVSGSMSYYSWGPVPGRGEVLIAYGIPIEILRRHYRTCRPTERIDPPLARRSDKDLTVYVCRKPRGTMNELWPEIRRFGHAPLSAR